MQIDSKLYVNDIVNDALRFLRQSTQFRELSGYDEELGVKMVNETLADLSGTGSDYPFYVDLPFKTEAGKKEYRIGNGALADVTGDYFKEVTFITVEESGEQYPVQIISDKQALYTPISTTTSFRPSQARVYLENGLDGETYTIIDFLYDPNLVYDVIVRGKQYIDQVNLNTVIIGLPLYFRSFLKLSTARKLVNYIGVQEAWGPMAERQYQEALHLIERSAARDLDVLTDSSLVRGSFGTFRWYLGVAN